MAKVTIDLTNYKDRVGTRVPEGRYRVAVEDVEEGKAKSSGNTMINVWFRVVGGEQDGATIIDRFPITDNALFRLVDFMQALGIPTPKKRLQIDINKWLGKQVDVDVEDGEPYNGRVRSEVRGFMRPAKAAKAEAADDLDLDDEDEEDDVDELEDDAEGFDEDVDSDDSYEAEEVEEQPKPKAKAKAKPKAKAKKKPEPEPEEEDDSDDDGELDLDLDEVELD